MIVLTFLVFGFLLVISTDMFVIAVDDQEICAHVLAVRLRVAPLHLTSIGVDEFVAGS